jgi:hypothetical protein
MNMINIVPVFDGHEDFTISEILRQKKDVGIDKVALSLSYHPQGAHAADLVPQLCKLFKTIADGVAGHDIEVGALIQSTMGHGWGKFSLTDGSWQQLAFERINDLQIKINEPLRICDPLILRMTF